MQIGSDHDESQIVGDISNGNKFTVTLGENEFIRKMTVSHTNFVLFTFQLTTSSGKVWGPYGTPNQDPSARPVTSTLTVDNGALIGI